MKDMIAALLAAGFCAGAAQAQTPPMPVAADDVMTLTDALRQADATVPTLEVAQAAVDAAQAQRRVAAMRPNPTVSVETENVVGTGPYRGFDQSETTVGFALPLELGGKRSARIGVAEAQTDRARIDAVAATADLRLNVTQSYIAALSAEHRLAVALDQVRITDENLRVARNRVQAGANPPIDEQRAALLTSNAAVELERARQTLEAARLTLAQYTGTTIGRLDRNWFDAIPSPIMEPRGAPSVEGTLALAAAQADVRTADSELRLARSQRVPDLTLSAGTRRLEATGDTAMVFGVSLPLPIFNNGRAAIDRASALRRQSDAQQRLTQFQAVQAITATRADRDRAAASVRGSVTAVAAAQEAARIARIGYREGKFDQLVLLGAEQALLEVRAAAIDARTQYHDAEARLARLTTPASPPVATGN